MSATFDVAVIGAGAAGMMCAAVAGQRGRRVVLIDHASQIGEKIRISGGGRCNFTNLHATPANFLSQNPHFCRSALARYTPQDFIGLVKQHRIAFHEKHRGQLFCDDSAEQIIAMLRAECDAGQVQWRNPVAVKVIRREGEQFLIGLEADGNPAGLLHANKLVIATGGLSIPKIGATDFAYRVARQFGVPLIEREPGLVPLTFSNWPFVDLAGVSLEVDVSLASKGPYGKASFREDLLFTHRGLSGPGVLQISSHWRASQALALNLAPNHDLQARLLDTATGRALPATMLEEAIPKRLSEAICLKTLGREASSRPVAALSRAQRQSLANAVHRWAITPDGSEGYRKAEVTMGGIDTKALSSQTMEVTAQPGLHFIGEAVDVTGHLGGFNFQWAWASGVAAGRAA